MNACLPGREHLWNPISLAVRRGHHSVVFLLCAACWQYSYKPVMFAGEHEKANASRG